MCKGDSRDRLLCVGRQKRQIVMYKEAAETDYNI